MLFSPVLKVILLLTLFNVISTERQNGDCDFPCDEVDKTPVCVYEKEDVCFRTLPSKCYMDRMNCLFQLDYGIYIDDYCNLEAFKCKDPLIYQSPPIESQQIDGLDSSLHEFEDSFFTNDYGNEK